MPQWTNADVLVARAARAADIRTARVHAELNVESWNQCYAAHDYYLLAPSRTTYSCSIFLASAAEAMSCVSPKAKVAMPCSWRTRATGSSPSTSRRWASRRPNGSPRLKAPGSKPLWLICPITGSSRYTGTVSCRSGATFREHFRSRSTDGRRRSEAGRRLRARGLHASPGWARKGRPPDCGPHADVA